MHTVEHRGRRLVRDSEASLQLVDILKTRKSDTGAEKVQRDEDDIKNELKERQRFLLNDMPAYESLHCYSDS